jgi:UDP-N-acetylglucosamine 2-epimerase
VNNLGLVRYYSAMTHATLMAGNSSSGIIEAASFNLPVVNIGERQRGRIRPRNVIDCAPRRDAVLPALRQAVRMRGDVTAFENPYYAGGAAERIVGVLLRTPLDGRLLRKKFIDAN